MYNYVPCDRELQTPCAPAGILFIAGLGYLFPGAVAMTELACYSGCCH